MSKDRDTVEDLFAFKEAAEREDAVKAASRARRQMQWAQAFFADAMWNTSREGYEQLAGILDAWGAELEKLEAAEQDTPEWYQAAWEKAISGWSREQMQSLLIMLGPPYGYSAADEHGPDCWCDDCRRSWSNWRGERPRENRFKP